MSYKFPSMFEKSITSTSVLQDPPGPKEGPSIHRTSHSNPSRLSPRRLPDDCQLIVPRSALHDAATTRANLLPDTCVDNNMYFDFKMSTLDVIISAMSFKDFQQQEQAERIELFVPP